MGKTLEALYFLALSATGLYLVMGYGEIDSHLQPPYHLFTDQLRHVSYKLPSHKRSCAVGPPLSRRHQCRQVRFSRSAGQRSNLRHQ